MIIGINCGHTVSGQPGCGAVGYIDESVETRRVGNKLMLLLSKAGHTVYDCTDDYAKSEKDNLNKIVKMANKQLLDLFVSIHFNKFNKQAHGTEVYTYGGKKHLEAVNVCNALHGLGFVNRGVKDGSHLAVVRRSNAKSMLVEVCFVDSRTDSELYKSLGADKVAQAICRAITGESVKEDIDMEELERLQERVAELEKRCAVYDYMDDNMPAWAKPTIQKLMDRDALVGDEKGRLGLTMNTIRTLVVLDRQGVFG